MQFFNEPTWTKRMWDEIVALKSVVRMRFDSNGNLILGGGGETVGVVKTHGHDGTGGGGLLAFTLAIVAKTGAYTATATDSVILSDASGGSFAVTLPTAVGITGRVYQVKKTDSSANAVTIDGDGSETIDGATTAVITTQYEAVSVISDGSDWHVI